MKTYRVKINGKTYNVQLEAIEETSGTLVKEEQPVKEEKQWSFLPQKHFFTLKHSKIFLKSKFFYCEIFF